MLTGTVMSGKEIMMRDFMKKMNPGSVAGFILCIVFGVILCIWPGEILVLICRIAALLILFCGALNLILGLKNGGILTDGFQTIGGIALCVVGLWILIAPASFIKLIPVVVGIVLIYHGIRDIYLCVRMRRADHKWWIGMITAAVTAVLGIVLIRCAFLAMEMGMVILGIFLIYDGISGLWLTKRRSKRDPIDVDYEEL